MDCPSDNFSSARQLVATNVQMPIRPYESKCENALMANEESAEEMEMEAEIARKSKAIEEVEARLKELEKATEAMNADD